MRTQAASQNPVVSLRGIKKSYLDNLVFENLDLDLKAGEFYALLGKNGSGKSTLIRILAHREIAHSGTGDVLGINLDEDFAEKANQVAFVSESTFLPADMKLKDALEINASAFSSWDENTARRLIDAFRLDPNKMAGNLSRGQLVQFSLILNLSHSPSLILLDEVTAVLDASIRNIVMAELAAKVRNGATVLLATNIVSEVHNFASSLILLSDRKVKLNVPCSKIAGEFHKLVRPPSAEHPIFRSQSCIEVGLSAEGNPTYLVSKNDALALGIPHELEIKEPISPAEIFVFLTHLRD